MGFIMSGPYNYIDTVGGYQYKPTILWERFTNSFLIFNVISLAGLGYFCFTLALHPLNDLGQLQNNLLRVECELSAGLNEIAISKL